MGLFASSWRGGGTEPPPPWARPPPRRTSANPPPVPGGMGAATAVAALVLALAGDPAAGVRIQREPTIQAEYTVTPEQKLEFERDGVTMLRNVVPDIKDFAGPLRHGWAQGVKEFALAEARRLQCTAEELAQIDPPREGGTYEHDEVDTDIANAVAGLQVAEDCSARLAQIKKEEVARLMATGNLQQAEGLARVIQLKYFQALNLRRFNNEVERWALSARLASAAAQLLGSDVRLYQDAFFRKGDVRGQRLKIFAQATSIHKEGDLIPVDTDMYVTAWCPLRAIDASVDSTLFFFPGSHCDKGNLFDKMGDDFDVKVSQGVQLYTHDWAAEVIEVLRDSSKRDFGRLTELPPLSNHTGTIMEQFCANKGDIKEVGLYSPVLEEGRDLREFINMNVCLLSANGVERMNKSIGKIAMLLRHDKAGNPRRTFDDDMEVLKQSAMADTSMITLYWGHGGGAFNYGSYEPGDCSMHQGQTKHAAPPQPKGRRIEHCEDGEDCTVRPPREAVSLSFVAKKARKVPATLWDSLFGDLSGEQHEDFLSYSRWWSKVQDDSPVGNGDDAVNEEILPVVWPQANQTAGVNPPRPAASPF